MHMNVLARMYNLILKPIAHVTEEYRRRTLLLGMIAITASISTAIADFSHNMKISTFLDLMLAVSFSILVLIDFKKWNFNVKIGYLLVFNIFITLEVFVEGLATATYLFYFVAIVSMGFLLDKNGNSDPHIRYYVAVIALSFLGTICFAPEKGTYEVISDELAREIFVSNCIMVAVLVSIFTLVGVKMEKDVKVALIKQKSKAEKHEAKISVQNVHLKEIAFMSAHSLRSPLTNIMSISKMINVESITSEKDKLLIEHLRRSSLELDKVIHDIVAKTNTARGDSDNDFMI